MRLNVAYSSDDRYARHVGVSMLSLLKNNKEFDEIYIYLIDNGISTENKEKLNDIAKDFNRNLIYIAFADLCFDLSTDNKYSLSSYARLFLSRIKDIDKIIYLDCDSIIASSFIELWKMDISNYFVTGVQDNVSIFYKTSIGLEEDFKYINAGFMLINLEKWRTENMERKFLDFIAKHDGSVPHHDQGTINAVCKDSILILHPKYNVLPTIFSFSRDQIIKLNNNHTYYSQKEIDEAKNNPCFIHFTNGFFNRPWNKDSTHPLKNTYLEYLNESPWKGELQDNKLNRNTRIVRFVYNNFPFGIYLIFNKLIIKRKTFKFYKNKK